MTPTPPPTGDCENMSIKHTPEPWAVDTQCPWCIDGPDRPEIAMGATDSDDVDKANAARIVTCVNAMTGVEYPECAMERVRGTLQNLLALCESQGLKGGAGLARECLDEIGRLQEKATP